MRLWSEIVISCKTHIWNEIKIQILKLRKCENCCDKGRKNYETEEMKIAES